MAVIGFRVWPASKFLASEVLGLQPPLRRSFLSKKYPPKQDIVCEHRIRSPCDVYALPVDPKPCFDIHKVRMEQGTAVHEKLIRSFLYAHYWPREPLTVGVWMPLSSPYIAILTEKYSSSGDRWLAFELQNRTHERRLIGVLVANKIFPWMPDELEQWAYNCVLKPEHVHLYFHAHIIRDSNLFQKYHVPYIYNIDVVATSTDVTGHGVAARLLRTAIMRAIELRHPLIAIPAKSAYMAKVCKREGMKMVWSMEYSDFVDKCGQSVFFPRTPHHKVSVFVREFNRVEGSVPDKLYWPKLHKTFKKEIFQPREPLKNPRTCYTKVSMGKIDDQGELLK